MATFQYPVLIELGKVLLARVAVIETEAQKIADAAPAQSAALREIAQQFRELARELGA